MKLGLGGDQLEAIVLLRLACVRAPRGWPRSSSAALGRPAGDATRCECCPEAAPR
ncbi:hypothetical protein G6O69_15885 [Pseudenhygromyxa sp. WMMC2535]|uniref:hypothetical protein n=1 Tax=Pseudenhygromyxa sp. WMMC2535 TaxID=2712867 RepID=UPI001594F233|nr:hypothetical protein [Pseudenhygromyxa sp. WMMC2535]NVB39324.1 hypothetical protein [Pseudenhygromyxa sp. WMMC2535]